MTRVLFVDDESSVLEGIERTLRPMRNQWTVVCVESGAAALEQLRQGPCAAIVCDMRMPVMNGIEVLRRAQAIAPDTVRIMLTGNADGLTPVDAINHGQVFRFLNKPCDPTALRQTLTEAVERHRLITAEKAILQETVQGAIGVLTEVLSLVNPVAFGRSARIARYVRAMIGQLDLHDAWRFEVAAMLSLIGCVTLPSELVEAGSLGQPMNEAERRKFRDHPRCAAKLIKAIPRLEIVAAIVASQNDAFDQRPDPRELSEWDPVRLGGDMLRVAAALDRLLARGLRPDAALAKLREVLRRCDRRLLDAVATLGEEAGTSRLTHVPVRRLEPGMVLEQDVRTTSGLLVVTAGQDVSLAMVERLTVLADANVIPKTLEVRVPAPPESVCAEQSA